MHSPSHLFVKAALFCLVTSTVVAGAILARGEGLAPGEKGDLGAQISAQYQGDGLGVIPTATGAELRTRFQQLTGRATREGLWLDSTEAAGGSLRLKATTLSRGAGEAVNLPETGGVRVTGPGAVFSRAGLVEEYSVSADGLRQDFVVQERLAGAGDLRLSLAVTGARAEAADHGARLVLTESGRVLAYSRLRVVDALGRELAAVMTVPAPDRISISVADATASYPVRIDPTFSDGDWVSLNPAISGANQSVDALAVDSQGNVYAAGNFSCVGSVPANFVAKWNGSEWSALGTGVSNYVGALVTSGTDVYACGYFDTAGGEYVSGIAKWNGTQWAPLGMGLAGGFARCMAMYGGDLYVAGEFSYAGGNPVNRIAKWNGSEWSAVGSGVQNGSVTAMAVYGGELHIAGNFSGVGGVAGTAGLAKWNGSAWSAVAPQLTGGTVTALAVSGGHLYAGGHFTHAGGVEMSYLARWDGSAWSSVGGGLNGWVQSMTASGSDLYVSGVFFSAGGQPANYIAKWNGTAWSALGEGLAPGGGGSGYANALVVAGGQLFAGGWFKSAGGVSASHLARWNGTTWSGFGPAGMDSNARAIVCDGADVYVGGVFNYAGGLKVDYIAKWNGSVWSALGSGFDGGVTDLAIKDGYLYACGYFYSAGGVPAMGIAKWDGQAWSRVGGNFNGSLNKMVVMGGDIYVSGEFTTANDGALSANRVAKWNGVTWSALGNGFESTPFELAADDSNVYACGFFSSAGGVPNTAYVARWDGTEWRALGTGLGGPAYALAVGGGQVYVGGVFSLAGGVPVNFVAQWNSAAGWSAMGAGFDNPVMALDVRNGSVYAAGHMTGSGGTPLKRLAVWNGTAWAGLGSGLDGPGLAITAGPDAVYVSGVFAMAGSTFSPFLAKAVYPNVEIAVEQPAGNDLTDGQATVDYATVEVETTVSKTFTIRSLGTSPLTGLTIAIDGTHADDFDVTSPPTSPVAPGGSTSFTLAFTPSALGARSAVLHIASDDEDENTFDIALSGTSFGIPDIVVKEGETGLTSGSAWNLGNAVVGTSKTRTLTITNAGSETLSGLSAAFATGLPAGFSISQPLTVNALAPGASATVGVTFTPAAGGAAARTLEILSNDPGTPVFSLNLAATGVPVSAPEIRIKDPANVELVDNTGTVSLGSAVLGVGTTYTFTILNDGTQALTGLSVAAVGAAPDFVLSQPEAVTLGFEGSTTFEVTFLPTALGPRTGTVKVISNDANENPFEIKLTGIGTAPEIAVEQPAGADLKDGTATVSFGANLPPGTPVVREFVVKNGGTAPLHLFNAVLDGAQSNEFGIGEPGTTTLTPGQSTTFTVTFNPSSFGTRAAALHIISDDANESPFDIKLTASVSAPEIDVEVPAGKPLASGGTVQFGPALPGSSVEKTFTLKNPGTNPLSNIAVQGQDAVWALTAAPATTVAAKGSTTFKVRFTPQAIEGYSSTLFITSNDPDESPYIINVAGQGVDKLTPTIEQDPESQIAAVGQEVTFAAQASSPSTVTLQWRKGAATLANIAGATTSSLKIAAAKLTDGAVKYGLRATNAAGFTDSATAQLTVVDRVAKAQNLQVGSSVSFTVAATSTGPLTYEWLKDGTGVVLDSRHVVKAATPNKLDITGLQLEDEGVYTCRVTGPGGSLEGGANTLTIFDDVPVITPNPVVMYEGIVSGPYSYFIPLDTGRGSATSFTATPLPPGLKINTATGEIYGKPTASKATAYALTLTAKNSKGTSTAPATVLIKPLTAGTEGDYVALIERGPLTGGLGGRLDLKVTSTGSFTGKVTLGPKTYALPPGAVSSAQSSTLVTLTATVARSPLSSLELACTIDTSNRRIEGGLSNPDEGSAEFGGWKNVWSAANPATGFDGYYTFAGFGPDGGSVSVKAPRPRGASFGSFKVPLKGESFTTAGRMADGDAFTSSVFLGPDGQVAIYDELPSKGAFSGVLSIRKGPGPVFDDNQVSGKFEWSRPPSTQPSAALYRNGFMLPLSFFGGRYVAPASNAIVMNKQAGVNNAVVSFYDAGLEEPSRADRFMTLIPGSSVTIAASGPAATTLKITTATGAFSGGFTLVDSHPVTPGAPRITRKVTFEGMIVRDGPDWLGLGYFLLPQLPTGEFPPPPVLPILSGGVQLE